MTYELTVSDGNQCSSVSSVTVTVTENPTVDAGDDGDYCVGDALGGNPTASGGSGGYSYSWSNFQLSDVNNSNPTLTGSTTGSFTYNLTVTDANNCVGTDAVVVQV